MVAEFEGIALRWIRRLFVLLVVLAVGAAGAWWWMGLELGEQPTQALTPAADIKFVDANGIRFGYTENGRGPLVLLLHGYPETARSWTTVQYRLGMAGYRAVAVYMRGYPPSGFPTDGNYSVAALGEDVAALISALGESKAIVVGHDWGATAALAVATNHPEKVEALVTLAIPHPRSFAGDPTLFFDAPHFIYYQAPWAERLVWSHDFAHIESIYRQWSSPKFHLSKDMLDDIKDTLRAPGAVRGALSYYWGLFKPGGLDPKAGERTISVPTLVIAGADDGAVKSGRFAKARGAFLSRYQYVEIPDAGHFLQMEAGDKVAMAIIDFLPTPVSATPAAFDPKLGVVFPAAHAVDLTRQCSRFAPEPVTSGWDPTPAQIQEFEAALAPALQRRLEDLGLAPKWTVSGFARQYGGVIVGGKQIIYVNGFLNQPNEFANWRTEPLYVCDGGEAFFGAEYDPATHRVSHLRFNGHA